MPRPVVRTLWWFALPALALPYGVYVVAKGRHALVFVLILGGLTLLAQAIVVVRFVMLRRRLRQSSGSLCLRCGYDLRGLDDPGLCPECGREFQLQRDSATWRKHVRFEH